MLKGDTLRAALVEALPAYGTDPDRLIVFAEKGRIATRMTAPGRPANHSFEYAYDLVVTLLDFPDHIDLVILPVLKWLWVNQPDLLQDRQRANEAIRFEAEILSAGTKDITLTLSLTEAVQVTARPDGGTDLQHLGEPGPIDAAFDGNPVLRELLDPRGRVLP